MNTQKDDSGDHDLLKKVFTVKHLKRMIDAKFGEPEDTEVNERIEKADENDLAKAYIQDMSIVDVDIIEDRADLIQAMKKEDGGGDSSSLDGFDASVGITGASNSESGEPPKPDAWLYKGLPEHNNPSVSVEKVDFQIHKSEEPLFSAETIQEVLDGFRDQIYEEENNATGMQEVAAIEIIRKLEEVFSGND